MKRLRFVVFILIFSIFLGSCDEQVDYQITFRDIEVTIEVGDSYLLRLDATENKEIEFSFSETGIIEISGKTIVGLEEGTVVITAKLKGTKITAQLIVNVVPKQVTTIEPESIIISGNNNGYPTEMITLSYEVLPEAAEDKTVAWASSDELLATVSDGKVSLLKAGIVTITATSNYDENIYQDFTITIIENFTVSYDGSPNLDLAETLLLVVETFNSDLDLSFQSSDETVLTVNQDGLVYAVAEGEANVIIKLGTEVEKMIELTVNDLKFDQLVQYLKDNAYANVSQQTIKYIGSDDGSADYDHDIVASVHPFLFNEEVNIKANMLAPTAANHSGRKMSSVQWIVVHDTANTSPTANARANSNWSTNPSNTGSSWHYTVGNDGWYQQLYDDDLGWHAGDGTATNAGFINTGIPAAEIKPELTISSSGRYVIKGVETNILAPLVAGRLAKTKDLVGSGIWPVIIDGTYHMPTTKYSSGYDRGITFVGGNNNGIGIETAVNKGSDVWLSWQRVAKLVAKLLVEHDLLLDRVVFHNHFSAKRCPRTAIQSDNVDNWLKMIEVEYYILKNFPDYKIEMTSLAPEILDHNGRVNGVMTEDVYLSYVIKITDSKQKIREFNLSVIVNAN